MIITTKPIAHDIHYKYRCPNTECNIDHWLSLQEIQTKGFIIVCSCGTVFKPKRIKEIKTVYHKRKTKTQDDQNISVDNKTVKQEITTIPDSILNKSIDILAIYGFTKAEAKQMLVESYQKHQNNDTASLVKQVLKSLEIK